MLDKKVPFLEFILPYTISIIAITFHFCLNRRLLKNEQRESTLIFENVNRRNADDSFINLLKYLVNYGFYKFGTEITLITLAITITYRAECIAIIYLFWLFACSLYNHNKSQLLCRVATYSILIVMFIQYLTFIVLMLVNPCNIHIHLGGSLPPELQKYFNYLLNNPDHCVYDFILLMMFNSQVSHCD